MLDRWNDADGHLDWWLEYIGATFQFAPAKVKKGSAEYVAWVEAITDSRVKQAEFIAAVKAAREAGKDGFTPTDMLLAVGRERAIRAQERERRERDETIAGYKQSISATPARKRLMRAVSGVLDKSLKPSRRLEAARAVVELMDDPEFGRGERARECRATYIGIIGKLERETDGRGKAEGQERSGGADVLAAGGRRGDAGQPTPGHPGAGVRGERRVSDTGLRRNRGDAGPDGAGDAARAAGAAAAGAGEDLIF